MLRALVLLEENMKYFLILIFFFTPVQGLLPLRRLLSQPDSMYELRTDLEDWEGYKRYAKYALFNIDDTTENYKMTVTGYSGNAGNSLEFHSGCLFSTKDRDKDDWSGSCAERAGGGGWYCKGLYCYQSNLNGLYITEGNHTVENYGAHSWYTWKPHRYSLKTSEMKIRRI